MACSSCGQRRNLTAQAVNDLRRGDTTSAMLNAQRIALSLRQDVRKVTQAVRSSLTLRPR